MISCDVKKRMTLKKTCGVSTEAWRDGLMHRKNYLAGEIESGDTESAKLRRLLDLINP
jgi:hypothetical protein